VTRVGRVVRKTSLDELLQLFNVMFAGNLSLVGQRAFPELQGGGALRGDSDSAMLQTPSLLAEGKPYSRIGEELTVSYKTVLNVSSKLNTNSMSATRRI
jgi:Bacterial sugar transferase